MDHRVGGVVEQGGAGGVGGDASVADEGDVIGDAAGEGHLVGDEDEVTALVAEVGDHVEHLGGHFGVEGGGGFVEEEEAGFEGDGSGDGDPLALAAGQFERAFVGVGVEAESGEVIEGDAAGFGAGHAVDVFQREGDVVRGGEVGEEVVGLEDEAGVAAVFAEGGFVAEGQGDSVEFDRAGVGGFEAAEDAEQGGFSAAGRADEDEGADIGEVEADVLEHGPSAEVFGQVADAEVHGGGVRSRSGSGVRGCGPRARWGG